MYKWPARASNTDTFPNSLQNRSYFSAAVAPNYKGGRRKEERKQSLRYDVISPFGGFSHRLVIELSNIGMKVEGRKRNLVALVNKLNVVYLIIIIYHIRAIAIIL